MKYGKGWEAVEKKHLVENMGSTLKLRLEYLLDIKKTSLSQYIILLTYTDIPVMLSGIIFSDFDFLKKIHSIQA